MRYKKLLKFCVIILFIFICFSKSVNAYDPGCREFTDENTCTGSQGKYVKCRWIKAGGYCAGESETFPECDDTYTKCDWNDVGCLFADSSDGQTHKEECEAYEGCKWKGEEGINGAGPYVSDTEGECVAKPCGSINELLECVRSKYCTWNESSGTCGNNSNSAPTQCKDLDEQSCKNSKNCEWNSSNNTCVDGTSCEALTSKEDCSIFRKCQWKNNECSERYVANKPCEETSVKKVLRLFGYLIQLLRLAVPLIIIIMGTFDVYEAVIDKDEKLLSKKIKQLGIRIVGGVFIFFIPTILNAIFVLSDKLNIMSTSEYQACETCLLKPSKCVISESTEENDKTTTTKTTTKTTTTKNKEIYSGGGGAGGGGSSW